MKKRELTKLPKLVMNKIKKEYGVDESLVIPSQGLEIRETDYYYYFQPKGVDKVDLLYVYNHSGLEVDCKIADQFSSDVDFEDMIDAVAHNHDIGSRFVASQTLMRMAEGSLAVNAGLLFYKLSRVVADSNRLERKEQFVSTPYRGKGVWDENVDSDLLGKEVLDSFFAEFEELVKQDSLKFIFYMHTMDEFGGGRASGGHEVGKNGDRRPESMIFDHYQFKDHPYGRYGADGEVDFHLLSENQIRTVQRIHRQYLNPIVKKSESPDHEVDIPTDYPYVSPRQLCGLASKNFAGPQLVLDVRKDLFSKPGGALAIAESVLEIGEVLSLQGGSIYDGVDKDLHPLVSLLEINSHSRNKAGVDQKAEYIISELYRDLDLDWDIYEDDEYGNLLIARSQKQLSDRPNIGLMLHIDTVHPPEVYMPVYQYKDRLYGPGASDMQGSVFAVQQTLQKLQQDGELCNLTIIFNTAEELGSPAYQSVFEQLATELDYLIVYELGGTDADGHGWTLVVERKGAFVKGIKTIGPGGHSGSLTKRSERKNAISQAIQMMAAIDGLADYEKGTTINLEYVHGGQKNTIIAQDCEFYFDARFKTESERERLKKQIDNILGKTYVEGVEVQDLGFSLDLPALPENSGTNELFELARAAAPEFDLQAERRGGWSDACKMYSYNPKLRVIDGFGSQGEGEHTRDEFIYIESIWKSVTLSQKVITHILNARHE